MRNQRVTIVKEDKGPVTSPQPLGKENLQLAWLRARTAETNASVFKSHQINLNIDFIHLVKLFKLKAEKLKKI